MKRRITGILTLAAAAVLLAGCATNAATDNATATPAATKAAIAESSYEAPGVFAKSVGTEDLSMQVWSANVPDETAAGTYGEPAAGNVWVTITTATKSNGAAELVDTDVAPVLRSTTDEKAVYTAVSPRADKIALSNKGQSYTFAWGFQVPEAQAVTADLVACLNDASGAELGCSKLAK